MSSIYYLPFTGGDSDVSPYYCRCDFSTEEYAETSNGMRRKHTHNGKRSREFVFDTVTHTCQDKHVHEK